MAPSRRPPCSLVALTARRSRLPRRSRRVHARSRVMMHDGRSWLPHPPKTALCPCSLRARLRALSLLLFIPKQSSSFKLPASPCRVPAGCKSAEARPRNV
eukprot:2793869-Pleurochrysis_carterae.AAC.1